MTGKAANIGTYKPAELAMKTPKIASIAMGAKKKGNNSFQYWFTTFCNFPIHSFHFASPSMDKHKGFCVLSILGLVWIHSVGFVSTNVEPPGGTAKSTEEPTPIMCPRTKSVEGARRLETFWKSLNQSQFRKGRVALMSHQLILHAIFFLGGGPWNFHHCT